MMRATTLEEKETMINSITEMIMGADYIDINFTRETLETAPVEGWRCYVACNITVSISAGSKVNE